MREKAVDPRAGIMAAARRLDRRLKREIRRSFDPECVICQNEGAHDLNDREHVMEGQE